MGYIFPAAIAHRVALTGYRPMLRPMLPLLAPRRTVRAIDCGRHKPKPPLSTMLSAPLNQPRNPASPNGVRIPYLAEPWPSRSSWAPPLPAPKVGASQGAYDAGVLRCSCLTGSFAQVSQECDLFLRQVQGTRVLQPDCSMELVTAPLSFALHHLPLIHSARTARSIRPLCRGDHPLLRLAEAPPLETDTPTAVLLCGRRASEPTSPPTRGVCTG